MASVLIPLAQGGEELEAVTIIFVVHVTHANNWIKTAQITHFYASLS